MRADDDGAGAARRCTRASSPTATPTRRSPASATSTSAPRTAPPPSARCSAPWMRAPAPAGPALVAMNERLLAPRRRPAGLPARDVGRVGAGERQRGLLARHLRRACAPTSRCCRSAVGPTSTASRSRAPPSTTCSSRCSGCGPGRRRLLPPRPALPRVAGRRHRAGGGRTAGAGRPGGYFELEYATPVPLFA